MREGEQFVSDAEHRGGDHDLLPHRIISDDRRDATNCGGVGECRAAEFVDVKSRRRSHWG